MSLSDGDDIFQIYQFSLIFQNYTKIKISNNQMGIS